uniref:Selenoprotein M n=1 Tax=Pyxicephalus adspersus TaxID=30357 RepID=A0AAV3A0W2_PYXAD|nr:TPA: hypothetical protein GDO54_013783 [Pyxicephalus adspersus]
MWLPLLLFGLFQPLLGYEINWEKLEKMARGKVELNRLKEVKAFVQEDIPLYHNLEMKHIPGADPELVLISSHYEELERIPLTEMKRNEINQLLSDLGFYKKESNDAPVPPEFQMAPAKTIKQETPVVEEGKVKEVEDNREEL